MHNNDQNKNNGYFERDHQQLRNDLEQLRSNHMDRMNHFEDMMHNMESKMPAIPVLDSKGNVIGQYKMLGDAKGYHYGSFYTNINQTPVLVIQNGTNQGTPVTVAVPGASSTIIGYLENPKYNAQMNGQAGSGSQMITLYQYTMPAVAKNTVKVQSYSHDNDNNDKHHKHHKHHHDEDDNDDNHRHHLITLF